MARKPADLHIFVDRPQRFSSQRHYFFCRALDALGSAGLSYQTFNKPSTILNAAVSMVHIDLTTVPEEFFPPKENYNCNINSNVRSIHRHLYSKSRILTAAECSGPVIVKTVLNHRGLPELGFRRRNDFSFRLSYALRSVFNKKLKQAYCPEYVVYQSAFDVPEHVWINSSLMVERFLPGILKPPIAKCRYEFFYDVCLHTRAIYDDILADHRSVREIQHLHDVPQAVMDIRNALGLDFGSMDYFEVEGGAVVIDVNKTTTCTDDWIEKYACVGEYIEAVGLRLVDLIRNGK